ncbi:hypothetical protein [Pseudogracilibacillus auburnensis]|uniref:hypothetical protein n=1 Tax=Pseudogracilibacillus auburnensis TaxID=1494959 RepID=UPI001A96A03A|nr:hypothetical protein [Pseudogracilibacillus auburnensis]MBO1002530.1 hypothetical protein [Pseudogracilibacillus auburnensis]
MTAEIVIMNKYGLSLAADSAITSGSEGIRKVYNSANKLFSLSDHHPIGIMVYGSASFMEVPWDVIIKTYRNHLGVKTFAQLQGYVDDFLSFLQQEETFSNGEVEEIIVYRIFSDMLKQIVKEVEEKLAEKNEADIEDKYITNLLLECVNKKMKQYQKTNSYVEMEYDAFDRKFGHVLLEIQQEVVTYQIPEILTERLNQLAFEGVKRDFFSLGSSGFVITGYGEEEIFPRLLNYRLEGFIFNQLKYKKTTEKTVSYTTDQHDGTAVITAFGQKEMIESFIHGIEPNMEEAFFHIIKKVLFHYEQQLQASLQITLTKEQVKELEKMGKTVYESIEDSVEEYKLTNYLHPLLGIIRSLPVRELAEMTEMLIHLTSFKRRVTRVTESVGPPIDIAVITKGDGFIWIKRKNLVNEK